MDKSKIKYVVAIQCDHSRKRCSGFACANSFFQRDFAFGGYPDDTRFITTTCGGCDGTPVAGQLEHFGKKLRAKTDISKSEVAVHLSTCVVTENRHHDRCPHVEYIKDIIRRNGYENIVEGTFECEATSKLRAAGKYKTYDTVTFE